MVTPARLDQLPAARYHATDFCYGQCCGWWAIQRQPLSLGGGQKWALPGTGVAIRRILYDDTTYRASTKYFFHSAQAQDDRVNRWTRDDSPGLSRCTRKPYNQEWRANQRHLRLHQYPHQGSW